MGIETPSTKTIENRISADVKRSAPDSNPQLLVSWIRSLIAGFSARIKDLYRDLRRTEQRVMLDTTDETNGKRIGQMFVGRQIPASVSSGKLVATGTAGAEIPDGTELKIGDKWFIVTDGGFLSLNTISSDSVSGSGTTATIKTPGAHGLSSNVKVTVSQADYPGFNGVDLDITITAADEFQYNATGSLPVTDLNVLKIEFVSLSVDVGSAEAGEDNNFLQDSKATLQAPLLNVDSDLYADFNGITGGADKELFADYRERYLKRIRNPISHFNSADIDAKAREVSGVTRVFVHPANTNKGIMTVASAVKSGAMAKVNLADHGVTDGQTVDVFGAGEAEYNVTDARVIVENKDFFYYFIGSGAPATGTGVIQFYSKIPLGQVEVFFLRDNDSNSIPGYTDIINVKNKILEILPANTASVDLKVIAPAPINIDFIFAEISPNTQEMKQAIRNSLNELFLSSTTIGEPISEIDYNCAINRSAVLSSGEKIESFSLSSPVGDIDIKYGEIPVLSSIQY